MKFAAYAGTRAVDLGEEDLVHFAGREGVKYVSIPQPSGTCISYKLEHWPYPRLEEKPLPGADLVEFLPDEGGKPRVDPEPDNQVEEDKAIVPETPEQIVLSEDGSVTEPSKEYPIEPIHDGFEGCLTNVRKNISESDSPGQFEFVSKKTGRRICYTFDGYDGPPIDKWYKFDRGLWNKKFTKSDGKVDREAINPIREPG